MDYSYSVLMSVYHKEKAEFLKQAMNSIWNQSIPTDDFVLVCDGPLTAELDSVIEKMLETHPETLRVVRLEKNGGLGNALNIGIKKCKHELVARMDSDDISRADRCEKQLAVFREYPEMSVISGIVEEFTGSKEVIEARRVPPEKHDEILQFAKKRNPFNHPCVMYKKTAVETAGGYQDFYLLEDYYLWIRMLQKKYVGYNLQKPLLWMRAGSDLYNRRGGWKYMESQIKLLRYMKRTGFINTVEFLSGCAVRFGSSLAPNNLRSKVYKKLLRSE